MGSCQDSWNNHESLHDRRTANMESATLNDSVGFCDIKGEGAWKVSHGGV